MVTLHTYFINGLLLFSYLRYLVSFWATLRSTQLHTLHIFLRRLALPFLSQMSCHCCFFSQTGSLFVKGSRLRNSSTQSIRNLCARLNCAADSGLFPLVLFQGWTFLIWLLVFICSAESKERRMGCARLIPVSSTPRADVEDSEGPNILLHGFDQRRLQEQQEEQPVQVSQGGFAPQKLYKWPLQEEIPPRKHTGGRKCHRCDSEYVWCLVDRIQSCGEERWRPKWGENVPHSRASAGWQVSRAWAWRA